MGEILRNSQTDRQTHRDNYSNLHRRLIKNYLKVVADLTISSKQRIRNCWEWSFTGNNPESGLKKIKVV